MPKVTAEQAKEELLQLFRAWTNAVGAVKDYAFFDRHLASGWLYTDYGGVQRGKDEYLRQLGDNILSYTQDMQRFDVRIVGEDIATVTGVYHATAELKGGVKLDNIIAFSAVWELQDGVWKALLHHTTRVPPAP